jgi:hypothetical protein
MNGYDLTRAWYNFKFDNPDKVKHIHSDFYFYLVDQWNRLGQKATFGLPTSVTMEALQIGSYNTYKKALYDLVEFGFVKIVCESKNQHQSKIVALSKIDKATDKALDKATIKATDKALDKATDTIIEQETIQQRTKNNLTIFSPIVEDVFYFCLDYFPENLHPKTQKEIDSWKTTIKQLHEIDGHDYDTIRHLIQKTREHDFWSKNFLSVNKLRKNDKNGVKYFDVFFEKFKIGNNGKQSTDFAHLIRISEQFRKKPNVG